MDYKIRTATKADFEGVGLVFAGDNRYHANLLPDRFQVADPIMTQEWYDRVLAEPTRTLIVAEADEKIAGLVMVSIFQSPDDPIFRPRRYAYVAELAVLDGLPTSGYRPAADGRRRRLGPGSRRQAKSN